MRRARAFFEAFGSPPRIDLCNEGDLIAVDVIGGDCTKRSVPCLEDDDRNHERGGERGGEGVCIFAGHLFWLLLGGGGPSPALTGTRRPKDRLTSPSAFGSPESTRRHGLARSPTPRGLISKTGFGPRKGLASGGWCIDARSRIVPLMLTPLAFQPCLRFEASTLEMELLVPRASRDEVVLRGETRQQRAPRDLRRLRRRCPPPLPCFR